MIYSNKDIESMNDAEKFSDLPDKVKEDKKSESVQE